MPFSRAPTVTAYDAAGNQIPVDDGSGGRTCYRTPAGYHITGPSSATTCQPATRWPS